MDDWYHLGSEIGSTLLLRNTLTCIRTYPMLFLMRRSFLRPISHLSWNWYALGPLDPNLQHLEGTLSIKPEILGAPSKNMQSPDGRAKMIGQ